MEEVTGDEIHEVIHSFQKNKSRELDGWNVDFYLGFYETLGKDLQEVVKESCKEGHLHPPLNSTFIYLIPNTATPPYMNDFRPISLYNYIYKMLAKVIARRINKNLSKSILKIQIFGGTPNS